MNQPITFLIWTENSPGVLLRLTGLFTRRKINVESLTVSTTEVSGISRFTVTVAVDPIVAATIGRQIERMIEVRRVFAFTESEIMHREVALVRAEISQEFEATLLAKFPCALVLHRGAKGALIQVTGTEEEISSLVTELEPYSVTEFVRSGRIAVTPAGDYRSDLAHSLHALRPTAVEGPW